MKKLMLMLALVGISSAAMAQTEQEIPTLKNTVQTNGFWDNWFVTVGGSYNAHYSSQEQDLPVDLFSAYRRCWNLELTIGKWFSPIFGVRIKGAGVWGKQVNMSVPGRPTDSPCINQWEISAQSMLNLNNLFCGYKPRVWNISPYLGVGVGHHMAHGGAYSPLVQFGINNQFNLCKRVFVNLDIYYQLADAPYDGKRERAGSTHFFSERDNKVGASLSLGVNLGKVGWTNAPDLAAINALNAAQLAALNEQLAEQENENARLKSVLAKPLPTNEVVRTVKEVSATPVSVFFNIGRDNVASKKDLVNVQALVDAAKANGNKLVITGYADSKTGSAAYNQALSERRANAVADAIVAMGFDRNNIEVKGVGGVTDLTPISYNRRAVIEVK